MLLSLFGGEVLPTLPKKMWAKLDRADAFGSWNVFFVFWGFWHDGFRIYSAIVLFQACFQMFFCILGPFEEFGVLELLEMEVVFLVLFPVAKAGSFHGFSLT